ncbi:Clavaminate synthase-like protein At3g21360 [Linum grandiflorum]
MAAFKEIQVPQQKKFDSITFPSVITPTSSPSSIPQVTAAIQSQKPFIESLLQKSGAVLIRGLPLDSASDFNQVVEAFGFDELPYIGGAAPRNIIVGRVYTANDAPSQHKITFHHEMSQLPVYPTKLFFFCEVEPGSGGETPLVLSHVVYERMKDKYPEFVEKLEEHGLIYTRIVGDEDDPTSTIGRGWKSTFLTDDKGVAEERAGKLGTRLEWMESGGAKTVMGPMDGVKVIDDDQAGGSNKKKTWFNMLVDAYLYWDDERNDRRKAVTFGDGGFLPEEAVRDCERIFQEESVAVPWKKGDVLLLDNRAVLHARNPFDPPRKILASLCK